MHSTAVKVGGPLALAALATAVGFSSFLPTAYRGLSELGEIAGSGMIIAFVTSITLLPALLAILNPPGEPHPMGFAQLAPVDRFLELHRIPVVVIIILVVILASPLLFWLQFDFNPLHLQSPKVEFSRDVPRTEGGSPRRFVGSYSGDNSYLASASMDSVAVTPAPTIIGTQNLFPVPIGVPVGFSVLARSNDYGLFGVPMSGTFTIFDGSTQLFVSERTLTGVIFPAPSSPYVWETLDGEITTTFSGPPGPHVLTVKYSGDANYSPSTSAPGSFNAVYITQTTLTSSAPTIQDGQPLTVTAHIVHSQTASSPPSGNVAFSVNGSPLGSVGVSNSQAQTTIPSLTAGNVAISAAYSGDSNYASSSGTFTEIVTPVSTSTTVTSSSLTVSQGVLVTLTAQIIPAQMGAAPLTGGVGFTANGSFIGSQTVSNNQARITTSFSTLGSVQVQATYVGDVNYLTSAGTLTETVVSSPPDFSITSSGTTSVAVSAGQAANFPNAVSVSALDGFSSPVNLSCALPISATDTTCSVSPSSFPSGSGAASVKVTTMARGLVPPLLPHLRFSYRPQHLFAAFLAALLAVILQRFARTRRQRFTGVVPLAGIVIFLLLQTIGCGGSSSSSPAPPPPTGTPAGTYSVTVTGASGNTTHTTTLTLIVN